MQKRNSPLITAIIKGLEGEQLWKSVHPLSYLKRGEETMAMELESPTIEMSLEEQIKWRTIAYKDLVLQIQGYKAEKQRIDGIIKLLEQQQEESKAVIEAMVKKLPKPPKYPGLATLSLRTTQAGYRVVDKEKAIQWAEANRPSLVKVEKSLMVSDFNDYAENYLVNTGELLPGFEKIPESQSLSIRLAKGVDLGEEEGNGRR